MQENEVSQKVLVAASNNVVNENLLFRSEVLNERATQFYGPLRLAQPLNNWIITLCVSIFVFLFLLLIIFGELPRKVNVIGITQPVNGSLSIIASNSGTLARSLVKEGDFVRTGQPIFEISTERQGNIGELTRLVSQQLQERKFSLENEERNRKLQFSEKRIALNDRIRNIDLQKNQLETEIELASKRKSLAEQTVEKYKNLQELKFASVMQLQEKQEILIDLEGRLGTLKRAQSQLLNGRIELLAQQGELVTGLASDLTQLKQTKASLEQEIIENQNRRETLIVSPVQGQITAVPYKVGQGILTGQVLATIVAGTKKDNKESELEIHLYVPSRTIGFIEKGQTVQLRYQAFPYQKFGLQPGIIMSVGNTPFAPNEIPTNIAATILNNAQQSALGLTNNEALYRVVVKPYHQYIKAYGREQFLKSGMSLDANIVQEKRYVWEWILEPARALRGY